MMVLPLAGLCYLFKYMKFDKEKKMRLSIRHFGVPAALFVGCAAVLFIEKGAYQDEDWQKYLEYNNYRSEVYDYYGFPDYNGNKEFYDSLDMGMEDVVALKQYSLLVVDGISEYKMKAIAEYAQKIGQANTNFSSKLLEGIDRTYSEFENGEYAPLIWFAAILLIAAFRYCYLKKSRQIWLCAACAAVQGLFWCYLGVAGRIVSRVGFAMFIDTLVIMAAILYRELKGQIRWEKYKKTRLNTTIFILSSILLIGIAALEWREVKETASKMESKNMEYAELCQYMTSHKENVYFVQTFSTDEYTENFTARKDFKVENFIHLGGWSTFSPVAEQKKKLLGITNGETAIRDMDNAYVLSKIDTGYLVLYMKAKYGSCHSKLVDTISYPEYYFTVEKFSE